MSAQTRRNLSHELFVDLSSAFEASEHRSRAGVLCPQRLGSIRGRIPTKDGKHEQ